MRARLFTREQLEAARVARHGGMSFADLGALLGCPAGAAKKLCDRQGYRIGPEARFAIARAAGLQANGKPRAHVVKRVQAEPDEPDEPVRQRGSGALPAGHPVTCSAIGIAPYWPGAQARG